MNILESMNKYLNESIKSNSKSKVLNETQSHPRYICDMMIVDFTELPYSKLLSNAFKDDEAAKKKSIEEGIQLLLVDDERYIHRRLSKLDLNEFWEATHKLYVDDIDGLKLYIRPKERGYDEEEEGEEDEDEDFDSIEEEDWDPNWSDSLCSFIKDWFKQYLWREPYRPAMYGEKYGYSDFIEKTFAPLGKLYKTGGKNEFRTYDPMKVVNMITTAAQSTINRFKKADVISEDALKGVYWFTEILPVKLNNEEKHLTESAIAAIDKMYDTLPNGTKFAKCYNHLGRYDYSFYEVTIKDGENHLGYYVSGKAAFYRKLYSPEHLEVGHSSAYWYTPYPED